MAEPDDIDKLLAEIDAMNQRTAPQAPATSPQPRTPTRASSAAAPPAPSSARAQWTGIAAGGAAVVGLVTGSVLAFLPYISGLPTAIGAALGGAAVAFVSGPPPWFRRQR